MFGKNVFVNFFRNFSTDLPRRNGSFNCGNFAGDAVTASLSNLSLISLTPECPEELHLACQGCTFGLGLHS